MKDLVEFFNELTTKEFGALMLIVGATIVIMWDAIASFIELVKMGKAQEEIFENKNDDKDN